MDLYSQLSLIWNAKLSCNDKDNFIPIKYM